MLRKQVFPFALIGISQFRERKVITRVYEIFFHELNNMYIYISFRGKVMDENKSILKGM